MAEIKTCEQYVVARALELEDELETTKAALMCANAAYDEVTARYNKLWDFLNNRLEVHATSAGEEFWVDMRSVWSQYNMEDFEFLKMFSSVEDGLTALAEEREARIANE